MCDCIKETNIALAKQTANTILDIPLVFNSKLNGLKADRVLISTRKLVESNRKKPSKLFATYCPFCGEKYKDDDSSDADQFDEDRTNEQR